MTSSGIARAFVAAVHTGDIDGLTGLFSDDAVIDDWGLQYSGKAQVREWCDREFICAKARMTVSSIEKHDCTETMLVNVGGHGFLGPGRFTFTVHDGRIRNLRITPD
jgi:hypothetical protein